MIEYRNLKIEEINKALFSSFQRYQSVNQCYRKIENHWEIRDCPFIDDWSMDDYQELIECLKHTIKTNGCVFGAFIHHQLKGFVSIESTFFGRHHDYLDLTSLHISKDQRGKGIGRELFNKAKDYAKSKGAKKLYISSHSAVETQAFYEAMGCVDAVEINQQHVMNEPYDRQLEYLL